MSPQQSSVTPAIAGRRHWSIPHILAVALAISMYFLIYSVAGDSDLLLAVATGVAGGALTWFSWKSRIGSDAAPRIDFDRSAARRILFA